MKLSKCHFTFGGDGPVYPGFTDGSIWNGWDNVLVTRETHADIIAAAVLDQVTNHDPKHLASVIETYIDVPLTPLNLYDYNGFITVLEKGDTLALLLTEEDDCHDLFCDTSCYVIRTDDGSPIMYIERHNYAGNRETQYIVPDGSTERAFSCLDDAMSYLITSVSGLETEAYNHVFIYEDGETAPSWSFDLTATD